MYCIDTSSLIQGWRRDYPPDVFGSLWEFLDNLIREGRLFAPVEVLFELQRGGDEIYRWAKDREHMFHEADEQVEKIIGNIADSFPNFVPLTSHDGIWADAHVVAFAAARDCIVVTGEKRKGPGQGVRITIPNVCEEMGIGCINLLELMRKEGKKF